jgi:hypothetical protein
MTNDTLFKLVVLGWDRKTKISKFFQDRYNLRTELGRNKTKLTIIFNISGQEFRDTLQKGKPIKEDEILETVLKLFRTVDGKLEGPCSEFFIFDQEWT